MRPSGILLRLALLSIASAPAYAAVQRLATVVVPVENLRAQPGDPAPGVSDERQETQLLFGEVVEVIESSGSWTRVHALHQKEFTHHSTWEGYPGWVHSAALRKGSVACDDHISRLWLPVYGNPHSKNILMRLPMGACVRRVSRRGAFLKIRLPDGRRGWVDYDGVIPAREVSRLATRREAVLATATRLIGTPYTWGGLSPADPKKQILLSGMDCSGLVHLSYRVNGLVVPRDAHEQYMMATPIDPTALLPGDLIFLSSEKDPQKIVHVMIYSGAGYVVEAPQTGSQVRRIPLTEKLGVPLESLKQGSTVQTRRIYFGRLFPDNVHPER